MTLDDTIVAISSAAGAAARMIVRASGPVAIAAARRLVSDLPEPGGARRRVLSVRGMNVPAWVYLFRGPHSYTGQDVVELHVPGNPLLARIVLEELIAAGARPAEAGEFTARAYFAGRMDLSEAEGVAATIAAQNQAELAAARQLVAGELARRLRPALDALAETLALLEAEIDFSDEEVAKTSHAEIRLRVQHVDSELANLVARSGRFERLSHEPRIVLVGRPNAGKSTLLNALAGSARAVVSPVPGTTRDAISADVRLQRGIVRIHDVAGLDHARDDAAAPMHVQDDIEQQMRQQALRTIEQADVVVLVRDPNDGHGESHWPRQPDLVVLSKADLVAAEGLHSGIAVSAITGQGMSALRGALDERAFGAASPQAALALNSRHLSAVAQARRALHHIAQAPQDVGPELLALDLREALDELGAILGRVTPDELLGRIFSRFCIGK